MASDRHRRPSMGRCQRVRLAIRGRERIVAAVFAMLFIIFLFWRHDYCWGSQPRLRALLVKSAKALDEAGEDWWLDWGTLLGHHRDNQLMEHEYDLDLGITEESCRVLGETKKDVFERHGLSLKTRTDYIASKRKPTWDTEKHTLVMSSGYIHSPCLRIYDGDYDFVDVYAYRRVTPATARELKDAGKRFDPPIYNLDGTKSNGAIPDHDMACVESAIDADEWEKGSCRHYDSMFPLRTATLDGVAVKTNHRPDEIMVELYGQTWRTPIVKGLRVPLCYYGMK